LTPSAGIAAVSETDRVLGLAATLDAHIPSIKRRDRGLSAGQLLVAMASCQLTGGDHLVCLDRRRADTGGQELEPVATPASRTAATLATRFGPKALAGIEAGIGRVNARVLGLVGQVRRSALTRRATIDIDATDVEVYGPTKRGAAYNYQGQRAYRPDIALWAELGVPIAADLLAGNDDPRASVVALIRRAHANLPAGIEQVALRMDTGYFAADAAIVAAGLGMVFAIGVKRNAAVWRATADVPDSAYVPVIGMEGTEVAVIPYAPKGWPAGIACLARRTRIRADAVSADPRARKRRTIAKDQLALALDGQIQYVYGYSFILTNLPLTTPHDPARPRRQHRSADSRRSRALVPPPHRHRSAEQGRQARRRAAPHALRRPRHQPGLDVGRPTGLRDIGLAAGDHQDRPRQRPRTSHHHPTTPRTDQHPGPGHPPRPHHRAPPAPRTQPPDHRPAPPAGTTQRLTRASDPPRPSPHHPEPWNPAHPTRQSATWLAQTPETHRNMIHNCPGNDHRCLTCGSGSDGRGVQAGQPASPGEEHDHRDRAPRRDASAEDVAERGLRRFEGFGEGAGGDGS
jgi:hypothetical protein